MDPSESQSEGTTSDGTAPWTPRAPGPDPFAEIAAGVEQGAAAEEHQEGPGASPLHPNAADERLGPPTAHLLTATTAPDTPSGTRAATTRRAAQVGAAAAVGIAAFLILGLWKPGFLNTTKLDITVAQRSIEQLLSDKANGYGLGAVSDVTCNNGQNPTVRAGATFTCTVRINGIPRRVNVSFDNSSGDYTVSPPQ
ncbi:hypothetical protein Mycsm_06944 (plasmid) [Mycobacterium sp. JS623]|uniref:DUF4333 domain-containing protein n=1 Tax=Mycobacterium sp. JS623 TaxID=212767 RepID=UPI0002A5B4B5|nr:DUF4333 domain-containing protein [Mycobacterium sp. JS623]AGB27045.1 hypothetical protein Mycsm_06944 [Mycobacterium sp. JS623]